MSTFYRLAMVRQGVSFNPYLALSGVL